MLENGTVISGTMIEKPHSFSTACNIATQIIAQVASNQYGGQSISLTHLAPFVDISRKKIKKKVREELAEIGVTDESAVARISEKRLREEQEAEEKRLRDERRKRFLKKFCLHWLIKK